MRLRAEFLDEDREKWLSDLDELDRIADSAIRLVREEVNQDAVEPLELDRLVRDIEAEMTLLGHAISIEHLDKVSVKAGALGLRRALRNLIGDRVISLREILKGTRKLRAIAGERNIHGACGLGANREGNV